MSAHETGVLLCLQPVALSFADHGVAVVEEAVEIAAAIVSSPKMCPKSVASWFVVSRTLPRS